ncbi:MAG: ferredoxin [bacterium]|nr:ferredoxin [bacterium]
MIDRPAKSITRREFIRSLGRISAAGAIAGTGCFLAYKSASLDCKGSAPCHSCEMLGKCVSTRQAVWQIDPTKCTACGNCATHCVLTESAVKCAHNFSKCGRCNFCFGYYKSGSGGAKSHTGVEFQLCPTDALVRKHIVEDSYEYTIDLAACTGCGICVKGCKEGNGSLRLQVDHDRCTNCNECTIATACPAQAFVRLPAEHPYWLEGKS